MTFELSRLAQYERDQYLYHLWADNPRAAAREAQRLWTALEEFAAAPIDGIEVTIPDWPRPARMHYVKPFKVFYERRPHGLFVIRMYHHARKPIER